MGSDAPGGISPAMWQEAARKVQAAAKILVISHARPDGDAIGCVVALREVLRGLGKDVTAVLPDDVPARYNLLEETESIPNGADPAGVLNGLEPDLLIIADTAAQAQVEPILDFIQSCNAEKLIIDHHVTRDIEAQVGLFDPSAGATTVLLLEWFEAVGWKINHAAAEALFVGLATDSGWFRFSNTDSRLLRAAARLCQGWNVSPAKLCRRLYMSDSEPRVRLLAAMLNTLELYADGRLAVCVITRETFSRTGAQYWETEDLISEPQRIATVQVAALLIEEPDGKIRISLRSKDGPNVATIARRFGGGGHEHAAGARLHGALGRVKAELVAAITDQLGETSHGTQRPAT